MSKRKNKKPGGEGVPVTRNDAYDEAGGAPRAKDAPQEEEIKIEEDLEIKEESRPPELEKIRDREISRRTQKRKTEVYGRNVEGLKKFTIEDDLKKSIDGLLANQADEILIDKGRKWLKEDANRNPGDYPAGEDEIEKFNKERVMNFVQDKDDFWDFLGQDEEWKKLDDLRDSIEYFKDNIPMDIKVAIFKKIPEGKEKEKVWERITGESISKTATSKAGVLEKRDDYISSMAENNFINKIKDNPELREIKDDWGRLSPDEMKKYGESEDKYIKEKLNSLIETVNNSLRGVKEIDKLSAEDILILLDNKFSLDGIKGIKKARIRNKIESGDGAQKFSIKDFKDIINKGRKSFSEESKRKGVEYGKEWDINVGNEREKIIKEEEKKISSEMIENCYNKMGREIAARWMEKEINKDPERKKKIEKRLGKGEEANIQKQLIEVMKKLEDLESANKLKGNWSADEKEIRSILEIGQGEEIPEDMRELYQKRFTQGKQGGKMNTGALDWVLDYLSQEWSNA